MSRLFLDDNNLGKVSYYDQKVYVPSSLRVNIAAPNGGLSSISNMIPIFVQSITTDRKLQLQVKQSLSGKFYALPFGEGPGTLNVTAIACTASQANLVGQQRTYSRLVDMDLAPEPEAWGTTFNTWQGLLAEALKPATAPTTYASTPSRSAVITAAPTELNPVEMDEARAESESQALEAEATYAAEQKALWTQELSTRSNTQWVDRVAAQASETPLSFQQVNAVFSRMAYLARIGGTRDRRPILEITNGGVVYCGRLIGLTSNSLPDNAGFQFVLQFILIDSITYPPEVMTANVVHEYDASWATGGFSTITTSEVL